MKSRMGLGLVLLMLVAPGAAASSSSPEADIRALLDRQVAAWNRGDLEGFMQTYWKSPRTAYLGSEGIERGWQSVLKRYRRRYPGRQKMGKVSFSELEIHMLSADSAFILGHWRLERTGGNLGGVFSLVVRKFSEGWKIVLDHTSRVIPASDSPR
jgi:ketosteroid isomerase-like protein